jgi:hypothetical protein
LDDDTIPKRVGVVILEIIPKGRVVLNNEAMQELACDSMDSPRSWIERCLENIGCGPSHVKTSDIRHLLLRIPDRDVLNLCLQQ